MDFKKTALQLRGYFSTPGRQLLLFSLIHFLILLVWLNFSAFDIRIHPDVELYLEYADFMFEGNLPYRDFIVEYPPLSLLFLLIPRLFSANLAGYADAFAVLIFAFALLGLFFTSRLSRKLELNHFATLGIYTLAFFLIGDIAINRFDVIPAVLSLGAVCYYLENKPRAAWFMLALGVLVKLYPAIIAPIFAIGHIRRREFRPLIKGMAVFCITGLAVTLPFFIASPEGFWRFIDFHSGRGLQIESSYASLLMLGDMLGLTGVEVVYTYSSVDLKAAASDFLVAASTFITLAAVFACYCFYCRSFFKGKDENVNLISYMIGALALLLVTSKIFSTQFVIWLYPFIPLLGNRMRHPAWIIFGIIALLTQYIFPYNYGELVDLRQPAVIFLILRNFLVLALGIAVMYCSSVKQKNPDENRRDGSIPELA